MESSKITICHERWYQRDQQDRSRRRPQRADRNPRVDPDHPQAGQVHPD